MPAPWRTVNRVLLSAWGCAIASLSATPQAAPLFYNALALPTVPNLVTVGQRLNDSGQVIGNLWGGPSSFSWSLSTGMTIWPGGASLQDLSDNGVLVGSFAGLATQWIGGQAQTLSPDVNGSAWYVNNNDWVVGSSPTNGWWLWRQSLGLLSLPSGFSPGAINDNGVIAGAFLVNGQVQSALWSMNAGLQLLTGTTSGQVGGLRAINNNGVFVGNDAAGSFMGTVAGDIYRLALPAGYTMSSVLDINASNVAVGWASKDGHTLDLVTWDHGVAIIPTVRGAPVQTQSSTGLQINDQGQILESVSGLNLQATLLLTPCSRCGQIHPNPNPDGSAIVVDASWDGAFNAENFLNQGVINVSSYLENTYTGKLTTDSTGSIEVSSGMLRSYGVMTFAPRTDGLASLAIAGARFEQDDPTAYTLNSGLVTVQIGRMDIYGGLWRNSSGARLELRASSNLFLGGGSWLDHAQGATLAINSTGLATVAGSAKLSNQGLVDVHGGRLVNIGSVFNSDTGEIRLRGDAGAQGYWAMAGSLSSTGTIAVADGGVLDITGTAVIGGGLLSVAKGGAITIEKIGTLWLASTARLEAQDSGAGYAALAFVNAGTFINSGTAELDTLGTSLGSSTYNRGRLIVQHGGDTVSVGGGWSAFYNDAGGYVEVGRMGGTLVNYGYMGLSGSQLTVAQDASGKVTTQLGSTGGKGRSEMHVLSPMVNELNGILVVSGGGQLWLGDQFINQGGQVELFTGGTIAREPSAGRIQYLQTSGITRVDGTLTVDTFACQGGTVHGIDRVVAPGGILAQGTCTIAPGDSPGTLTLDGDATFDGTTFEMQVGSDVADQLIVTGHVALQGGQVMLSFLDGAMPDPDDTSIALFKFSSCMACVNLDALPVSVVANSGGWLGRLVTSQSTSQTLLSLANPDALILPDNFEIATSYEVSAGTAVFQTSDAIVDAGATLTNSGSFYNRLGATLTNSGLITNATGGGMLNHGVVFNGGDFVNEAGAWFNNRGEFRNVDAVAPARLVNRGSFINWQDGVLRNGDEANGLGGLIDNQPGATLINRGLIINRGQRSAYSQSDPSLAQVQIMNRGVLENYGTINNNGYIITEGGSLIVHAGGQIVGPDGIVIVRPGTTGAGVATPATVVVDGTLEASVLALAPGTRLSGIGTVKADLLNVNSGNPSALGTIAPGNGIGTLTIDGLVAGGTVEIEVSDATQFDHLVVSGSVYLHEINYLFGADFVPHAGDHLAWLSASEVHNTDPWFAKLNFSQLDATGGATSLPDWHYQIVNNKLYTLLQFGSTQVYAVQEASADGFGLDFVSAVPAPVPEPQSWQYLLGGVFTVGLSLGRARRWWRIGLNAFTGRGTP